MAKQTEKVCTKCGKTKNLAEFYRNVNMPDGRHTSCKACMKEASPYKTHRNVLEDFKNNVADALRGAKYFAEGSTRAETVVRYMAQKLADEIKQLDQRTTREAWLALAGVEPKQKDAKEK